MSAEKFTVERDEVHLMFCATCFTPLLWCRVVMAPKLLHLSKDQLFRAVDECSDTISP